MTFLAPPPLDEKSRLFQMEILIPSLLGMQVIPAQGQQLPGSDKHNPLRFQIPFAKRTWRGEIGIEEGTWVGNERPPHLPPIAQGQIQLFPTMMLQMYTPDPNHSKEAACSVLI